MEEMKKERDALQIKLMNLIYDFEKKHGVSVSDIKGIRDKTFGEGIYSIQLKIEV